MESAEPRLIETGKGFTIKYRGRYLYSSVDPPGGVQKRVARLEIPEQSLVYVPSLGLGYGLEALLAKLPDSSHILCIEADQKLMALALKARSMHHIHLPEDPRLTIIRTDQNAGAVRTLHALGVQRFRRLLPLNLCGGLHLYQAIYREMGQALEQEIRTYWQNKITLIKMSRLWLKNLFQNLGSLAGAEDLGSLRTAKPVIVTGAGPSLEESLDWIGKVREKVLLLAADTALPVLLDAGLMPDYTLALESQLSNLQDFLPHYEPRQVKAQPLPPLICDLTANPLIIRSFGRRVYFFASRFYPLQLFNRLQGHGLLPTTIPPRGSVGVVCLHVALRITPGPVIFTGLDFSYYADKTHARGAPLNRLMHQTSGRLRPAGMLSFELAQSRPLLRLRGKDGRPVLSDLVLQSYALQLNQELQHTKRVFDLASRGLPTRTPRIRSEAELHQLCAGSFPAPPHPERSGFCPSPAGRAAFFKAEGALLRQAEKSLQAALPQNESSGQGPGLLSERARQSLQAVEYAVLDFPDALPELPGGESFLRRALHSVQEYLSLIARYR